MYEDWLYGSLAAYLAITDTVSNPTQHVVVADSQTFIIDVNIRITVILLFILYSYFIFHPTHDL